MRKFTKDVKIGALSLGCDKNRVDLEKMLSSLKEVGFEIVANEEEANIILVNTCGFIEPARKESIESILNACALKGNGFVEKVVVTGCLVQKNMKELKESLPEVDEFVLLKGNENIASVISKLFDVQNEKQKHEKSKLSRVLTTLPSFAFLKIADGCNNCCSYCTIPRIRGRFVSVPMEELLEEARELAKIGVRELVIVAQDTTRYGMDLPEKPTLIQLVNNLSKLEGIEWIRLHYCYPEMVTDELIDLIRTNNKVCKYIDVPFQHIDDTILKSMNRRSNEEQIRVLVKKLRAVSPKIAIRTTFIVGLPGENRKAFKKLCNFVEEANFEMAGFFPYSKEEGTKAYYLPKQVFGFVKKLRLKKIQKIQAKSLNNFVSQIIGQEFTILVDSFDETTMEATGRTEYFSPEDDMVVKFVSKQELVPGEFVKVKITEFNNEYFKGESI